MNVYRNPIPGAPPQFREVVEFFKEQPSGTLRVEFAGERQAKGARWQFYLWRRREAAQNASRAAELLYPLYRLIVRLEKHADGRATLVFENGDANADIAAFDAALKAAREQALTDLAEESQRLGLYDLPPLEFPAPADAAPPTEAPTEGEEGLDKP